MDQISWTRNPRARMAAPKVAVDFLAKQAVAEVLQFHRSFHPYQVTPLRSLSALAQHLGVGGIYVKDESCRFGLNAFKVLGCSYAMGQCLAERLQLDLRELPYARLTSAEIKQRLGEITFVAATDGNHGKGVAWTARQLGQRAVIYMPKGSSRRRLEAIQAEGAEASITELNYDDAVRLAASQAEKHGWLLIQDTAWEGYEKIPSWIMQGYTTMASEALDQLNAQGIEQPSHMFLQAGVGSLAGAVQGFFAARFTGSTPITAIVESNQADCLLRSAQAGDGKPRSVTGSMETIMAGLACGEPSTIGWNILRDYSELFLSCPDYVAAKGMRMLGNPLADDCRVIAGESGAVTTGMLALLMTRNELRETRQALGLAAHSKILLFNTEGDTDPESYRSIVWDGQYPSGQGSEAPC